MLRPAYWRMRNTWNEAELPCTSQNSLERWPPGIPHPGKWGQPRSVELPSWFPADSRHVNSKYLTHVPLKVKVLVSQSYPWTVAHQVPLPTGFPGKNTGMSCHSLLQGIFSTQGSNLGLLHCRQMLYSLSHQGSPCASKPLQLFVTQLYFSKS